MCKKQSRPYTVDRRWGPNKMLNCTLPAWEDSEGKHPDILNKRIAYYDFTCSNGHSWRRFVK